MKKVIFSNKAPNPVGPYSQGILVNGVLYVSGQIALSPVTGKFTSETIEGQTKQVFDNLSAILKEAGFSFANVVKTSIFLDDMNDFTIVNEIYATYFDEATAPARETVAVQTLPKNSLVEISCIAVE